MSQNTSERPISRHGPAVDPAAAGDSLARLPEPAALLFDLDGRSWTRSPFGSSPGAAPSRMSAWRSRPSSSASTWARTAGGLPGRWHGSTAGTLSPVERDELDRASGDAFYVLNSSPKPLAGATELLTALEKTPDSPSRSPPRAMPGQVAASVDALRLPSPPRITDGSHVEHAKPEPDLLLESAAQLGVAPERCWYVGDSKWDMMACARAGMLGVAVTTGATPADGSWRPAPRGGRQPRGGPGRASTARPARLNSFGRRRLVAAFSRLHRGYFAAGSFTRPMKSTAPEPLSWMKYRNGLSTWS